ncbi:MAG TPA: adenylate kinase [Chloroflexi bacterium]|nr:adenylate kinase [Chloroflexota bacterium]
MAKTLDLMFLGAPGSGKGTQAKILGERFNLKHVASGDLFRENLKNETELGKLAKSYMERGDLVPDDVTIAMLKDRLSRPDVQTGFMLDGFPRTIAQAEALGVMMAEMERHIAAVLYLNVPDDVIVERLSGRLICRNCQNPFHLTFNPPGKEGICDVCGGELYQRDDDKPETVRSRLKIYHIQTKPLVDYYSEKGALVEIDGAGGFSEITERLIEAVQQL